LQGYLTAYYNHPGVDINWQGVPMQDGINGMPTDAQGRKYVDCEAYSKISEEILGNNHIKHFDVSCGAHDDGRRDHQVSVVTEGDNAYVISNNQITRLPAKDENGQPKAPEKLITEAHPEFSNVVEDGNGPLKFNSNSYANNMKLPFGEGVLTVVQASPNQNHFEAHYTDPNSNENFHVTTHIDEDSGKLSNVINPKQDDTFYLPQNNGESIKIVIGANPPRGTLSREDAAGNTISGSEKPVTLIPHPDGSYDYRT
jgi:hypothetical protein